MEELVDMVETGLVPRFRLFIEVGGPAGYPAEGAGEALLSTPRPGTGLIRRRMEAFGPRTCCGGGVEPRGGVGGGFMAFPGGGGGAMASPLWWVGTRGGIWSLWVLGGRAGGRPFGSEALRGRGCCC